MAFQDVWNPTYETIPQDTDQESLGAGVIRDVKINVRQRFQTDHSLNGDQNDGMHTAVDLIAQAADPAPAFLAGTSGATLYTKVVNSIVEMFFKTGATVVQLTTGGLLQGVPPGTIIDYAGATVPAGYLECNGQAVSRTTYASLFTNIGTIWGVGDGSTTFNVPNLNNTVTAGRNGAFNTSGAGAFPSNAVGAKGGEISHQQTQAELVGHNHPGSSASDSGHSHNYTLRTGDASGSGANHNFCGSTSDNSFVTNVASANISLVIQSQGGGAAMNIVQPTAVVLKAIKF